MDTPSPAVRKLVSQGPEEETSSGVGGRERRRGYLVRKELGGPGMDYLCGALKGRQALVGSTGRFQETVQQLMTMYGAHGSGQKPELET